MWPFGKSEPDHPPEFHGICPDCEVELIAVRQACRNKLPVLTCPVCNKTFDYSYNPSHVFYEVQSQRRDCRASAMKQHLRETQLRAPKYIRERYWIVYELPEGVTIFYDSANKFYNVQIKEIPPITVDCFQQVIDFLSENISVSEKKDC